MIIIVTDLLQKNHNDRLFLYVNMYMFYIKAPLCSFFMKSAEYKYLIRLCEWIVN